jgi:hypothetical protein
MLSILPARLPQQCMVTSPGGVRVRIPSDLFKVLWDFLLGNKETGSVVIQFRNGGIAGIEAQIKRTYK